MMKAVWSGIGVTAAVMFFSTAAYAQAVNTATANVTATAVVAAKARLEMSGTVAFADADPETVPTINSAPLTITVKARTASTGAVTLTVVSGSDLMNGTLFIPISSMTWGSTGAGYVGGTSNKTTAQSLGAWTGSGTYGGAQTYSLPNSWTYATGTYTATLTYTLTSP
jgi:hypothetical protein